jgi:hypothetical protein
MSSMAVPMRRTLAISILDQRYSTQAYGVFHLQISLGFFDRREVGGSSNSRTTWTPERPDHLRHPVSHHE